MNKKEAYRILKQIHTELVEEGHDLEDVLESVIDGYFYESAVKPSNLLKEAVKILKQIPKNNPTLKNICDSAAWKYVFQVVNNVAKFSDRYYYFSFPVENMVDGWYDKSFKLFEHATDFVSADEYCNNFEIFYDGVTTPPEALINTKINRNTESTEIVFDDFLYYIADTCKINTKVLDIFQKILLTHTNRDVLYVRHNIDVVPNRISTIAYKSDDVVLISVAVKIEGENI